MKIKDSWNFKLLYKSDTDPQIEKDMKSIEAAYAAFEKRYKNKSFTSSSARLLKALVDYRNLEEKVNGFKPYLYFSRKKDVESGNALVAAKEAQCENRVIQALNKIVFFRLELGKIPASRQKAFLKDQRLAEFRYFLKLIFDRARYNLTEEEEQLAGLLSQTSYSMWVDGQTKLLSAQTVAFKGRELPIAQAISILSEQPKALRERLHRDINEICKRISPFAEAEINAIYNLKKIMDERRGFAKPYSATILNHETEEKTVRELVKTVSRNFDISKRFYKLHAKLLKQKRLTLADRNASIGKINKKFSFAAAADLVKKSFTQVDPVYAKTLGRYISNGQIDVAPRRGKRGGAYCAGSGMLPVFVMLNHTEDIRSLETLAHEMGHAFHTEASRIQPPQYREYSTAVAEVASTFFEQVAASTLEEELSSKERIILLHNRIKGDIASIFAQIAFFNFELELHERIRKEGQLPKEEIARLMAKHFQSYIGDVCDFREDDGYFFVRLAHIRWHFYVYSYAYGQLVSRVLYEKWKENPSYSKQIEKFLSAGGSMSPEDIFKSIGIDTSKPAFFEAGLKSIERDIARLEKLAR